MGVALGSTPPPVAAAAFAGAAPALGGAAEVGWAKSVRAPRLVKAKVAISLSFMAISPEPAGAGNLTFELEPAQGLLRSTGCGKSRVRRTGDQLYSAPGWMPRRAPRLPS